MSRRNPPDSPAARRLRAVRWLLPSFVLVVSAVVTAGIFAFGPSLTGEEVSRRVVADCTGARTLDFGCHQERYRELVLSSGVEAAFADLVKVREDNGFVRAACHQLTHVIGRTAAEVHGGLAGAYARGDLLCSAGYYHGVTEAVMAEIGAEGVLKEADEVCAGPREDRRRSTYHYNCVHGMGHGFMGVFESEVFESLEACDALTDAWEADQCYGGVFMENLTAMDNPSRPSKFLRPEQPLYPCTAVEDRYKKQCYDKQTAYAVYTQNDDFAGVFELCATAAERDFRPACYRGLGGKVAAHSNKHVIGEAAKAATARDLCALGEDRLARSNCVIGVVETAIRDYGGVEQARALCESLQEADLRAVCLKAIQTGSNGIPAGEEEQSS